MERPSEAIEEIRRVLATVEDVEDRAELRGMVEQIESYIATLESKLAEVEKRKVVWEGCRVVPNFGVFSIFVPARYEGRAVNITITEGEECQK